MKRPIDRLHDLRDMSRANEQIHTPFAWAAVRQDRDGIEEIMFVSTRSREDAMRYLDEMVRGGKREAMHWQLLQLLKVPYVVESEGRDKVVAVAACRSHQADVHIYRALDEACAALQMTLESAKQSVASLRRHSRRNDGGTPRVAEEVKLRERMVNAATLRPEQIDIP